MALDRFVRQVRYPRQRFEITGLISGDVDDGLVFGDPAPGTVLLLRQLFAPAAQVAGNLQPGTGIRSAAIVPDVSTGTAMVSVQYVKLFRDAQPNGLVPLLRTLCDSIRLCV